MKVKLLRKTGETIEVRLSFAVAVLFGAYFMGSFHWLLIEAMTALPLLAGLLILAVGMLGGWVMKRREKVTVCHERLLHEVYEEETGREN